MTTPLGQGYGHSATRCMVIGVKAATTGNHGLSGLTAVDGITPIASDLILVWQQTTASQNGLYVAGSGNWKKLWTFKANTGRTLLPGALISVYGTNSSSQYQKSVFEVVSANTVVQVSGSGGITVCLAATTGNHGLSGLAAVDGYTPSNGDKILVWQQTTTSQNGIYSANSSTWTKLSSLGATSGIPIGQAIAVVNGTAFGKGLFLPTTSDLAAPFAAFYS